ncbi:PREDICTED: uncharacterized protein LOC108550348 isoform X1 [Eufriesea mexicana]|uniref:uncharacterized protein LOC108550348 isoform X1 n=1 Tax=Eufriesea mexicana TaxID=516756 RepID=UPI00083C11D4|nr:PREDICTED: uncharacterized protein LOC108550348 isoform X1 [Eufriesea mexicana]
MVTISSKIIFVCLLFNLAQFTNSFSYVDIKDVIELGEIILTDIFEAWKLIQPEDAEYNMFPFIHKHEKEVKNKIAELSTKLNNFEGQMNIRFDAIMTKLLIEIPLQQRLDQQLRMIDQFVGHINDLYNTFKRLYLSPNKYEKYTMEDFARTCVSVESGALPNILQSIHQLIVPSREDILSRSVLISLANTMQETSTNICNEKQTLQQLLYNLYTMVTLSEIKGYSMMQFSYHILRLYTPSTNFTEEMNMVKQQYEQRTIETLRAVKTAMAFAPREMWKCDPEIHKLDETYTTLTQLFQGYIVNEVDLNSVSTCKENCAYYEYTEVHGCYKNQFCSQQRKCNGRVLKCEFIDSDMWICPSDPHSDRRYEYIQYENDKFYGQRNTCKKETIKVDSWWRWLFWHCSYCFCYCDDNNKYSDRYFSLKQVVSDVANNKVVTGIRFKKVNHIIHMQIQEGELMPRGNINKISLQWKPIEEFSVLDNNVKNGVDYHTLSWANRGLDLDDLSLDTNHLLTGVRFRMVGSRLNLEIRMSTFNFTTGKLIQPLDRSFWTSRDLTDRIELKLTNPDIPIRPSVVTLPDSKSEQYLNFAPSDKISDVAQNTIPFLDTQPIELDPPVPIAGAGIFHKGRPGSGGYVALRLITYDFSKHLQVDLPLTTETVLDTPSDMKSL